MSADDAKNLEGQLLDRTHYDRVIRDSKVVLKPDGTPLLIYIKDALPRGLCELAFEVFDCIDAVLGIGCTVARYLERCAASGLERSERSRLPAFLGA